MGLFCAFHPRDPCFLCVRCLFSPHQQGSWFRSTNTQSRQNHLELKYTARSLHYGNTGTRPTVYAACSSGQIVPNVAGPRVRLPMGMRNCRCTLFIHPNPPTRVAPFSDFLEKRMHAKEPERERRPGAACVRGSGRRAGSRRRALTLTARGALGGAAETARGCSTASTERPASGDGGRLAALISLSPCDPPTRRGPRTPPTQAQVFLHYSHVALQPGVMPFGFLFYSLVPR